MYMGRSKKKTFNYLKERVWKKIQGWKEKLLSRAGKDILIKAMAQAIPAFAMSCFDLTKTLCDEISSLISRFFWAQHDRENKMHWIAWDKLCSRTEKGGLGYRDLHLFNLAMLARQAWRLLSNLDSLCARVLKAKYFPDGKLMEVRESPGISYSWRSIVRGVQVLKVGLIWRVGDSTDIDMWNDPWIPLGTTRRPITPRRGIVLNKVANLINPITGEWDRELIQDIFWEEDVKNILAIPVHNGYSDVAAWHFDPRGIFLVKLAYHTLEYQRDRQAIRQIGESSSGKTSSAALQWEKLWRLNHLPKVKHFLWRLAHNSLPLRQNISKRGMEIDTRCPVCLQLDENGGHCFFKCKFVKPCWRMLNFEHIRQELSLQTSTLDVYKHILNLREDIMLTTVILLWNWWDARNKVNAGEDRRTHEEVYSRVIRMVSENSLLFRDKARGNPSSQRTWCPPPQGVLKLNIDGAFQAANLSGGWGFILRDHEGNGVLAGAGRIELVDDALSAEAVACLHALRAALNHGFSYFSVETDSSILVSALDSACYDQSTTGMTFKQIRTLLRMDLGMIKVSFANRSCNSCAHELARKGASWDPCHMSIWADPLPDFVQCFVVCDYTEPRY